MVDVFQNWNVGMIKVKHDGRAVLFAVAELLVLASCEFGCWYQRSDVVCFKWNAKLYLVRYPLAACFFCTIFCVLHVFFACSIKESMADSKSVFCALIPICVKRYLCNYWSTYYVGQKTAPDYISDNFIKPHSILISFGIRIHVL